MIDPLIEPLIDPFGRTLDYLRVSITDRCNLRCVYCMPPAGVEWKPHDSMLRFEEIIRLCGIMAAMGIRRVKVTGGEPLVRKGTAPFIRSLKAIRGIEQVTITTNGLLLDTFLNEAGDAAQGEWIAAQQAAIPDAFNISLDSLNPERFARITRSPPELSAEYMPQKILSIINDLLKKNIPLKINCVPVRGFNEEDMVPIAALAKDKKIAVRFIELMPMGIASALKPIPNNEVASILEKQFGPLTPFAGKLGNGPARYYTLKGFLGNIGFISPLSHNFCESCNRLRLSSGGILQPCLSSDIGTDLRLLLRGNASDAELANAIMELVLQKPRSHTFLDLPAAAPAGLKNSMYRIGG
ncbi:cyclic pyranopterin monophosphate synthase [Spirochaetia bacterium]|nr:cyclic pyranopterin monophosphate synthase [Spirochaetia bacterium]